MFQTRRADSALSGSQKLDEVTEKGPSFLDLASCVLLSRAFAACPAGKFAVSATHPASYSLAALPPAQREGFAFSAAR